MCFYCHNAKKLMSAESLVVIQRRSLLSLSPFPLLRRNRRRGRRFLIILLVILIITGIITGSTVSILLNTLHVPFRVFRARLFINSCREFCFLYAWCIALSMSFVTIAFVQARFQVHELPVVGCEFNEISRAKTERIKIGSMKHESRTVSFLRHAMVHVCRNAKWTGTIDVVWKLNYLRCWILPHSPRR